MPVILTFQRMTSNAFVGHPKLSLNGVCLHSGWRDSGYLRHDLLPGITRVQETKTNHSGTYRAACYNYYPSIGPVQNQWGGKGHSAHSDALKEPMAEGGSSELWSITNPSNHNTNPIIQREKQLASPPPHHTSQPKATWESSHGKTL